MTDTPQKTFRLGRIALFASLCLNLALAGYVASQWLRPDERPLMALQPARVLAQIAARLNPGDAAILREAFRTRETQLTAGRVEFGRALSRTLDLLEQPRIDMPALRAAIDDTRAKRMQQNGMLIDAFLDAFERMSPDGRKSLLTRLRTTQSRNSETR